LDGACALTMLQLIHYARLCAPMFALVALGWVISRAWRAPQGLHEALSRFVFNVALPALLFGLMSDLSRLPPVDPRVLLAFFGGCLLVFGTGRLLAWRFFALDAVSQSLFALAGIFSNNVLLGIPLAQSTLGAAAMPTVALVLVFNALTLWTLATVSVEWARHGSPSLAGFGATLKGVLRNPLIMAILSGSAVGMSGFVMPPWLHTPLGWVAQTAGPLALVTLGMGLAAHGLQAHLRPALAMCGIKLLLQPLVVWGLARLLGLGHMETRAVTLLASLATGANVYLMSRQFKALEGPVAASLVLSTALAAFTTPLWLAWTA
jgi:malonate transporter